jgi:predicted enzyme related to lactoylglutathione lyase
MSFRMKLPFFKSRKRKAKEEAELAAKAAEQEAAEPTAEAAAPAPKAERQTGKGKTRRVPAEQVVDAIGYALAAVPSLGPTVKAWRKLGFHVSDAYTWEGCQAAHIDLEGGGIRFLAADSHAEATSAVDLVRQRLILGSGLFGWTWSCAEPHRSAFAIGELSGSDFHAMCEDWSDDLVQIPMELTPAAATWLEREPSAPASPSHANSLVRLDHVVLQVSASKAAAQTYEKHFGLKGRTSAMNDRYYAFLKAGRSLLEIVGPLKPGAPEKQPGKVARITGGPWGVAFRSTNIDATVTFLRMAGVDVNDPHRAVQGGRITGMTTPLGGIQLAFMGD